MIDMDQLSGLAQLKSLLESNPLYKASIEQRCYESYKKKLDAYHAKEFTLTHEQIDKVIRSIKSGRNTYRDLKDALPSLNSPTLCSYLADDFRKDPDAPANPSGPVLLDIHLTRNALPHCYFQLVQVPENFYPLYEFKPTDTFGLSVLGENRWYEIKQLDRQETLTVQAIRWAKISAVLALIGLFITIWQILPK